MKFEDLRDGDEVTVTFTTKIKGGYQGGCLCTMDEKETAIDKSYLENMMKYVKKSKITVKSVKKDTVTL